MRKCIVLISENIATSRPQLHINRVSKTNLNIVNDHMFNVYSGKSTPPSPIGEFESTPSDSIGVIDVVHSFLLRRLCLRASSPPAPSPNHSQNHVTSNSGNPNITRDHEVDVTIYKCSSFLLHASKHSRLTNASSLTFARLWGGLGKPTALGAPSLPIADFACAFLAARRGRPADSSGAGTSSCHTIKHQFAACSN